MAYNGDSVTHKLGDFDDTGSEAAVRLVRAVRKVKKNATLARKTERLRILEIAKLAFEVRTSRQRIYVCLNVHKILNCRIVHLVKHASFAILWRVN